jgi:hypothetical protein
MNFNRRRFLGASIVATAGLITPGALATPRVFATPRLSDQPAHLPLALAALDRHGTRIAQRDQLAIADFSAHSRELRLHLVDIADGTVRNSYLVAHGRGSDPANSGFVQRFSNRPGSNASSEGSFLTGEAYHGRHGRSRRLHGLEDHNDRAFERAIVIHGASYVDRGMARERGRVGRSLGCFAFEQGEIDRVLDLLGPGRLLFAAK